MKLNAKGAGFCGFSEQPVGYDFGKEAGMCPGINRFGFTQDASMADYVSWNQLFSGFAPPSPIADWAATACCWSWLRDAPRERSRNVSWNHRLNKFRAYRGLTDGRRFGSKNGISTNRLQRADCAARAKSVVVPAARAHARERSRNVSRNQRFHKFRTYRGLGRRGTPVQRSGCRKQNLKG